MPSVKVVIVGTGFASLRDRLRQTLPEAEATVIDAATLLRDGAAADVLIPTMSRVDGALMDRIRGLRLIQQWGVGLEGVDIPAATERRIAVARVSSAGSGNAESVAEWCIMAAIAISRRLPEAERSIRAGGVLGAPTGRALLGRRAGILGVGGIGQALATRLRPFGTRMIGIDQRSEPVLADRLGMDWIRPLDALPQMLSASDYLFLCLPLTTETHKIIDAGALARLPDGACVVNAGRGGLLDQAALLTALQSGRLLGAALDVFDPEPLDPASPLLTRSDVLATPHIAGVTDASFNGVGERVAANIRRLLNDEALKDCVNGDALA